jgi:hypothetical protein
MRGGLNGGHARVGTVEGGCVGAAGGMDVGQRCGRCADSGGAVIGSADDGNAVGTLTRADESLGTPSAEEDLSEEEGLSFLF